MTVLDTTLLISSARRKASAMAKLRDLMENGTALRLPAIVWTEYLSEAPPAEREAARAVLEATVRFEPFDRQLADEAARLQYEMLRSGNRLAWSDLQIATTALHYDEPLVSNDKTFDRVPGLLREGY